MSTRSNTSGSVLLQPYRSLGLISSNARPHLKLLGQERFLTTALGRSWCVYNLEKLKVVMIGGAREHTIRSLVSVRDVTFTTCGSEIIIWRRQEEMFRVQHHQAPIYLLYLFGKLLISVDESQLMTVWDVEAFTPVTSVKSQVARAVNDAHGTIIDQDGTRKDADWKPTPISTIQFPQTSHITSILHPSTYLNKIVVGFGVGSKNSSASSTSGGLEIWNLHTRQMVYRFKTDSWSMDKHNPDKMLDATLGRGTKRGANGEPATESIAVTCLEQSPAVDVIAVGLQSGLLILLNILLDQIIHVYIHSTPGSNDRGAPISSVTFRTDNNQSQMASTAENNNTICIWDLEKKQLKTMIKNAHGNAGPSSAEHVLGKTSSSSSSLIETPTTIHTMYFLPNEPLLLTIGSDNALKMWIFDSADGSGRLLKERSGHAQPPCKIRFYPGERGCLDLISAGGDRSLRTFSLQKEEQSREFSQTSVEKRSKSFGDGAGSKLTQVIDFAVCDTREKEYPNIITAHVNDAAAYTWKWSSKALSQHKLLNTTPGVVQTAVKSVTISPCGNFGLVGYQNGRIDSFHMQSGTFKATYGSNHITESAASSNMIVKDLQSKNINLKRKAEKEAKNKETAAPVIPANQGHSGAVIGLAIDGLNHQLISASLDGSIIFWDFKRRHVLKRVQLDAPINKMGYARENDLLAIMTDKLVLYVIDSTTYTIVRKFHQHTAPLTDLLFSSDGKWLCTSSSDCCVRVFDLPSSTMVDFLRFNKPVSSMAMSPNCDFLATSHVGNLAIHLWANKEYFGSSSLTSVAGHEWRLRQVHKNIPVQMDIKERQAGGDEDEDMNADEEDEIRIKQEVFSSEDEDEDDEEESDEESESESKQDGAASSTTNKRRRLTAAKSAHITEAHTPLLHLTEEDQFALITYSSVPKSKWQTLIHLDEIKQRNKAKEAVQAPKDAPFFLTALSSLSNEKDGASLKEKMNEQQQLADTFGVTLPNKPELGKRAIKSAGVTLTSSFIELIEKAKIELVGLVKDQPNQHPRSYLIQAYAPVTAFLQSLTPSAIDGELGSLGLDPLKEVHEYELVLEYFLAMLETQKQFEFVQALLNRFLKFHGSSLIQYPHLLKQCTTLKTMQQRNWGRLEEAFHANLALISHLAQIQL